MKVNFSIFVYIHIPEIIEFIVLYSFLIKSSTKVYIQNTINKRGDTCKQKMKKLDSEQFFYINTYYQKSIIIYTISFNTKGNCSFLTKVYAN